MWRQFADANGLLSPGHGVGVNYLAVCERASGTNAPPLELLRQRPDGSQAWVELRRHALRSGRRWTIVTLAHALNLKVVVEGVETEKQSRLLRLLNCEKIQGYLFSRPVPREEFEVRFLTSIVGA